MNKLSKSAAIFLLAMPLTTISSLTFAGTTSGCGLGQIVFEGQSGLLPNILAMTTNTGLSSNQVLGLTSGTSGCDDTVVVTNEYQRKIFVSNNLDSLSREIAQGQGDHLSSLATLMGVSLEDQPIFFSFTQNQYGSLFSSSNINADQLIAALDNAMRLNPTLSKYAGLNTQI